MKITEMTIEDYEEAISVWQSVEGVELHDDIDSRGAIGQYLQRNAGLSFVVCGRDALGRGYEPMLLHETVGLGSRESLWGLFDAKQLVEIEQEFFAGKFSVDNTAFVFGFHEGTFNGPGQFVADGLAVELGRDVWMLQIQGYYFSVLVRAAVN